VQKKKKNNDGVRTNLPTGGEEIFNPRGINGFKQDIKWGGDSRFKGDDSMTGRRVVRTVEIGRVWRQNTKRAQIACQGNKKGAEGGTLQEGRELFGTRQGEKKKQARNLAMSLGPQKKKRERCQL